MKLTVLEAEKECKTNPAGNGYIGTTSVSAYNHDCIPWADALDVQVTDNLGVDDISETKDYCRKLAGSGWNDPACVFVGDRHLELVEKCDIKFCGKSTAVVRAGVVAQEVMKNARLEK